MSRSFVWRKINLFLQQRNCYRIKEEISKEQKKVVCVATKHRLKPIVVKETGVKNRKDR
jgi:hypothetical protein